MALNDRKCYKRKDSSWSRPHFWTSWKPQGKPFKVMAKRWEEDCRRGRKEERISKDGRHLVTPQDTFAIERRKYTVKRECTMKIRVAHVSMYAQECESRARVHSERDDMAHITRRTRALIVKQNVYIHTYTVTVIYRYWLTVVAFVLLLQEVYRINPCISIPQSSSAPLPLSRNARRHKTRKGRDKLTDDWYLMKICLPAGRKIHGWIGDELAPAIYQRRIPWQIETLYLHVALMYTTQ